jgi:hypothetical protein
MNVFKNKGEFDLRPAKMPGGCDRVLYLGVYLCQLGPAISQISSQKENIMDNRQAIISFSQSEKIKSGLIWCSQCVQIIQNLPASEQPGASKMLQALASMIGTEAQISKQASKDPVWTEVDKFVNNARVMIESGVVGEAEYHFTQALSQVNRIGQKAMTHLIEQGLLT